MCRAAKAAPARTVLQQKRAAAFVLAQRVRGRRPPSWLNPSHAPLAPPRSDDGEPGSPGDSGGGAGGTVTLLSSKALSTAPAVDTTGLALLDNRAVSSASTRMLLREWCLSASLGLCG